jgi:hypothetical protein
MKKFTTTTALVAISALFLLAGTQQADAALSKADQGCRKTIAKGFGKLAATANKTIAGCHKSRNKGKIVPGTDCNDLVAADVKGKVAKAAAKLTAGVAKKCLESGDKAISGDFVESYLSCPEPCGTDLALSNPLNNLTDLGSCLACLGGDVSEGYNTQVLGSPDPLNFSSPSDSGCASAVAKGYGKLVATMVKDRTGCQKGADKTGDGDTIVCSTSDAKGKIAKALGKAEAGLDKKCLAADLVNVASCATDSMPNLKDCLEIESNAMADELFAASYALAATICPTGVDSTLLAGVAPDGTIGRSSLKTGWSGVGHSADLPHGYKTRINVDCGVGATPPCGDCTVTGAKTTGEAAYNLRCRDRPSRVCIMSSGLCRNNISQSCSVPFGIDPSCPGTQLCDAYFFEPTYCTGGTVPEALCTDDSQCLGCASCGFGGSAIPDGVCEGCPGVGNCDVILSPPLPLSAGSVPVCVISRLDTDYSGTVNNESGSANIGIGLRSRVYTGITVTQPCPTCVGDTTFDDGVQDGTCLGGPSDGTICDGQGEDATFGVVSLDCPPDPLTNISGLGLVIKLEATTGAATLPYDNTCDAPLDSLQCPCGTCSGDPTYPCRNDAECAAQGFGTCTSFGAGTARKQNACGDGVCSPDPAKPGMGYCPGGPSVTNCDGAVKANGDGYIGCKTDFDCTALNLACPGGDCGTCSLSEQRSCFLNPIALNGIADPDNPLLATTFCVPPASSVSLNDASGLPGPGRVLLDSIPERTYD